MTGTALPGRCTRGYLSRAIRASYSIVCPLCSFWTFLPSHHFPYAHLQGFWKKYNQSLQIGQRMDQLSGVNWTRFLIEIYTHETAATRTLTLRQLSILQKSFKSISPRMATFGLNSQHRSRLAMWVFRKGNRNMVYRSWSDEDILF